MSGRIDRRRDNGDLVIDNVLSTQPELGPTIPEGGWGWVVFLISLFFQSLIPSLMVSFGIFLAFSRVKFDTIEGSNPKLWDNKLLHVPLFFIASWTFFDPTSRRLIAQSTWPKLFATAGTCLTCSGLLFVWMGMTGQGQSWLFVLAGTVAGIGASIQMSQCEILLAQYFRLKLPVLVHLGHAVAALGFILAPIIVGHHILSNSLAHVILWYQALILQGLILNLLIRKPMYLKKKTIDRYNFISTNPDDEEDIFSKNSRELQIKVQNHHGTQIQRHELPVDNKNSSTVAEPSTSSEALANGTTSQKADSKNWVSFEQDNEEEEATKYVKVQQWEGFDEEDRNGDVNKRADPLGEETTEPNTKWEKFEDDPLDAAGNKQRSDSTSRNSKNLHLELSFGNMNDPAERPTTRTISGLPIPLFADTPVNNNNTYSYDMLEDQTEPHSSVFMPTTTSVNPRAAAEFSKTTLELLQQPTFYKSLVTVITTKWSVFVFFALYPSFLYQEVPEIKMKHLSNLVGTISLATLIFAAAAYFINIEKKWRPKVIWSLTWIGALGYFMISDYFTEGVLLFGAVQIVLSIAALQHVGSPLLGLTVKGEATKEYTLISVMTGLSFLLFVVLNVSFQEIFRLMALLNFLTGSLWLANYIYKRLRVR